MLVELSKRGCRIGGPGFDCGDVQFKPGASAFVAACKRMASQFGSLANARSYDESAKRCPDDASTTPKLIEPIRPDTFPTPKLIEAVRDGSNCANLSSQVFRSPAEAKTARRACGL
jgi:hypothetical protein